MDRPAEHEQLGHWFGPFQPATPEPDPLDDAFGADDPDLGWGPPEASLLYSGEPEPTRSAYLERPRWMIPTLAIGIILALLAMVAGRPNTAASSGVTSPFLGSPGHAELLVSGAETLRVESGVSVGQVILDDGPTSFLRARELNESVLTDYAHFAVESEQQTDQRGRSKQRLSAYGLAKDGAFLIFDDAAGAVRYFNPALPMLPAGLKVGDRRESVGTVLLGTGGQTTRQGYVFRSEAQDAQSVTGRTDCLRLVSVVEVAGRAPETTSTVRCPGRGLVTLDRTGHAPWTQPGPDAAAMMAVPGAASSLSLPAWSALPAATAPSGWTERTPSSLLGSSAGAFAVAGDTTDGSTIFYARSSGALVGARLDGKRLAPLWFAYPGERIFQAWTHGDLVLVATADRRLVAYTAGGLRLWEAKLAEIVTTEPAGLGELLVVLTPDGEVTALDVRTGARRWSAALRADTSVAPLACGSMTVVTSSTGELVAFTDAGQERWRVPLEGTVETMSCTAETVVTKDAAIVISGLAVADGRLRWRRPTRNFTGLAIDAGGAAVLVQNAQAHRLDVGNGALGEPWPGEYRQVVASGGYFALVGNSGGQVVLPDGSVQARWPAAPQPSDEKILVGRHRVWLTQSALRVVGAP